MYQTFRPSQPSLVAAIMSFLGDEKPSGGVDVALMNKVIEAANLVCEECARERVYADKPMTPKEWLASDDTGQSSKYMLSVLAELGCPAEDGPTPRDAADFGRCLRMVRVCGFESDVSKMREYGDNWQRIADNWGQLVAWYDADNNRDIYGFLHSDI
ncbi:hypothetical protein [Enterovibrio sp. 27052020O]|uniref:hypothetical protein n=1 Tax=Enterovibrio sp. 27052020O TaxID=3241166 RepID=UPI00388E1FED